MDFKEQLENIGDVKELNLYINSPGGDVFVASTIISMLKRKQQQGATINAYVDGVSASAASFLMCVANNIYLYKNSIVMIHKPMSFAYGNAIEMQKTIDTLNTIENGTMIPLYMTKSKISEEKLKQFIDEETWFTSEEMADNFNVTILDEEKLAVASIKKTLGNFKNIPENIKKIITNKIEPIEIPVKFIIDDSELNNISSDVVSTPNDENINDDEKLISTKIKLIDNFLSLEKMKGLCDKDEIKSDI